MLVHSLIFSLVLVGAYAAPTEAPVKPAIDAKNADSQKSAAPLEEQNKARTHSLLNLLRPQYGYSSYPSSSFGYSSYPASSYGYSSYPAPSNGYASYPAYAGPISYPSYQQPILSSLHAAPVSSVHVAPIHVASAPVHVAPAPVVSQTTYTKPVVSYTPTVVKKPTYAVSEQVLHQPVVYEIQQINRRPVHAEIQQVIHKPVYLEYQQAFKLPTQTVHIVKKPTYSSVQHETLQNPLILGSQQHHVVEKPTSQVLQLPTQYVKPYPAEVVHVPSVHQQTETQTTIHHPPAVTVHETPAVQPVIPAALPAVSYQPSYDYSNFGGSGSSLIGSGSSLIGSGSNFLGSGSSFIGPGSGFSGIGSSFAGLGSSGYDDAGVYLSPSTCRGGDCQVKRDADVREIVIVPNSPYTNQQMLPTSDSSYNPNVMPTSSLSLPHTSVSDYFQSLKNTQDGDNSQQPTQALANGEFDNLFAQGFEPELQSMDVVTRDFGKNLLNNPDFQKMVIGEYESTIKKAKSAESDSKVQEVLQSLTDEQKKALGDQIKKMIPEGVVSSTTPASVRPAADQKSETPKV